MLASRFAHARDKHNGQTDRQTERQTNGRVSVRMCLRWSLRYNYYTRLYSRRTSGVFDEMHDSVCVGNKRD